MGATPRTLKVLTWFTAGMFLVATWMVLFYAPREAVMARSSECSTFMWPAVGSV